MPLNDSCWASLNMSISAALISFAVIVSRLIDFLGFLLLLTNRSIQAKTQTFLLYFLKLFKYHPLNVFIPSLPLIKVHIVESHDFFFVFLNSASTSFSFTGGSSLGHEHSGSLSQSGPSHHLDSRKLFGSQPLEGRSAGFIIPGT